MGRAGLVDVLGGAGSPVWRLMRCALSVWASRWAPACEGLAVCASGQVYLVTFGLAGLVGG